MTFRASFNILRKDYKENFNNLFIYHLIYLAIFSILVFPFFMFLLNGLLSHTGTTVIENFSIVSYFLSPIGLLTIMIILVGTAFFVTFTHYSTAIATSSRPLKDLSPLAVMKEIGRHFLALLLIGLIYTFIYVGLAIGGFLSILIIFIFFSENTLHALLGTSTFVNAVIFLSSLILFFLSLYYFIRFSLVFHVFALGKRSVKYALSKSSSLIKNSYHTTLKIYTLALLVIIVAFVIATAATSASLLLLSTLDYMPDIPRVIKILYTILILTTSSLIWFIFAFFTNSSWMITTRSVYRRQKLRQENINPYPLPSPHIPFNGIYLWASIGILFVGFLITLSAFLPFLQRELNETSSTVKITAHRGSSLRAPENTMSAVNLAIKEGAETVEIDVLHTKDGVVVVSHDNNLKRMAGIDQNISDMTHEELQSVDVGKIFSPEFEGEQVPRLEDVINAIMASNRNLNIEIKEYSQDEIEEKVANIIRETNCSDHCFVTSLDYGTLKNIRAIDSSIPIGIAVSVAIGDVHGFDVDFYSAADNLATNQFIAKEQKIGRDVMIWTLNDKDSIKEAIARGAKNIITDDPLVAQEARESYQELSTIKRFILSLQ